MLPQYTFALGGTEAVKDIVDWLNNFRFVEEELNKKYSQKEGYAIGQEKAKTD